MYIESYYIHFEKQLPNFKILKAHLFFEGTLQMEMKIYVNASNKNNFVSNIIQRLCLLGSGQENLKIYYSIV